MQIPSTAWLCLFGLLAWQAPATAGEESLRLERGLALAVPDLVQPGTCVRYQEGRGGFLGSASPYWLEGVVTVANAGRRQLQRCQAGLANGSEPVSRAEFLRQDAATPCLLGEPQEGMATELVLVRIEVRRWESPWDKQSGTKGRLFRGYYRDQPLQEGMPLELEAVQLHPCPT